MTITRLPVQLVTLTWALLLVPIAPVAGQSPETQVTVTVPGSKIQTFELAMSTIVAEQLPIQQADAASGFIITSPYKEFGPHYTMIVRVVLLSQTPDTTRVVIAATYDYDSQGLAGLPRVQDQGRPVTSADDGPAGRTWSRMRRIADAVLSRADASRRRGAR